MNDRAKYIIYSILDFGLFYGGTAGVIVYNYITPDNTLGYKLTFTGICLLIALILMSKAIFEKHYRQKMDSLLEQLANATDPDVKAGIKEQLDKHKTKDAIYKQLMILLPFIILYVVTWLGATALSSLNGTVGLILLSMTGGSIFNILKKPIGERLNVEKVTKKVKAKKE